MVSLPHLLRSSQTLAHVLQDGVHLADTETAAIQLAQGLAAAGLVELSTFDYVLCVNPEDDDYLDLLGNHCDGRVQVSTEPLLCPSCGRQLEYPELYKQVYHETIITLNPPAIAGYVFDLFADTSGVITVKRLDPMTGRLLMADGSEIEVIVDLAPDPATRHARKERSAVLTVCNRQRAPTRHPDNRIGLVELLTEDGAWREQRLRQLTVSPAGVLPPRRGHSDQLDIRVGVLQEDAYPVEFTINGTRHFQGRAVAALPDPAARTGGDALFLWLCDSPTLLAAWKTACEGIPPLRIRLRLDATELHALPWEAMRAPIDDDWIPVAAADATAFSRYLAFSGRPRTAIDKRPIRIVAAFATPTGLSETAVTPIDAGEEWRTMAAAIQRPDTLLERLEGPCTLSALEERLRQGAHILHLVAHGVHDGHHSGLLLEADDRRALIVAGEEFAAMIGRVVNNPASSLRLIVLDSCHTATVTQATALHSTAVEMVRSGAAAVIAMRGAITPQSARAFSTAFYANLLRHGLVDLAANQARSTLLSQRREDAFLPVLYMRLPEGALLQQGAPA